MSIVKGGGQFAKINKFPNVDLNDTDKVRHKIIDLVDDYFEYDCADDEQKANASIVIDDIFHCFYENGFFTYDYSEGEMDRIKKDTGDILKRPEDGNNTWLDLHSEQVFNSHPGAFVILIIKHMLCYSGENGLLAVQNRYWKPIARKVSRFVMSY